MELRKILVVIPVNADYQERFAKALPGAEITYACYDKELFAKALPGENVNYVQFDRLTPQQLASFDAVVGNPDPAALAKLSGMRLLQLNSSGVPADFLTLRDSHPGLVLCSASGAFGQAVSEHMVAVLMMLIKRLHEYRDAMWQGAWKSLGKVISPRGMQVLMVGAGSIGTAFARLMQALGSHTIGVRRTPGGAMDGFDEMHTYEQLDGLLPRADVVALAVPETAQTINLMDARRFSLMKEGSYLINVGRGSAVDQEALLEALRSGRLAGASIDVTTPEPLPADHPLWQQKNLLLTPHVSGFYHLKATHDAVVDIACRNLAAFPEGPYISRVDYDTGYRAR